MNCGSPTCSQCAVSHRAIICNLQQLNFDELKYWLNSVQAHVYNPDYKYEKYIFLVGTHQRPLGGCHVNESTLKILNDKLKEKFNTDPFLNGIHFYGGSKGMIIGEENSEPIETSGVAL